MFAAVEAFLTANSDCNGTSYSAGQQQPIFRGSVFSSEHKRTPRSLEWCWHQAQTISTCPPPAHTPHSCHHPRRLDVHSPPATPDHRLATKQSSSTGTHRAAAFLRQGDEFPPSGPYLLACAQSGQLLLRLGDLDAIKDDDQNGDDQNDDDLHNHHLVIKPPRALVISLKRVQLLPLKEISTPTPCTKMSTYKFQAQETHFRSSNV